jgi:hypothetical protein
MAFRALVVLLALMLIATPAAAAPPPLPSPSGDAGPVDLAAAVFPPFALLGSGFGVSNGRYLAIDEVADSINNLQGGSSADLANVAGTLKDAGWAQSYAIIFGAPAPGLPGENRAEAFIELDRYAGASGAAAGYDLLHNGFQTLGFREAPGAPAVGDQSWAGRHAAATSDQRQVAELAMIFQAGANVVTINLRDYTNQPPDMSTLRAIADGQAKRLDHPPDASGLSLRALAFANVTTYFSAYYLRVDNIQIPLDGEDSAQLASDDRYYSGQKIVSSFTLEQRPPSADGNDGDYLEYAVELNQYATAKDAAAALATNPKSMAGNPGPDYAAATLTPNPPALGDGAAVLAVTFKRSNGVNAPGYLVFVVSGAVMMTVTVESPAGPTKAAVTAVAKAALGCLAEGACDPLQVPSGLGA